MAGISERRPGRHPWLERLVAEPAAEVRALLGRHAEIFPYERAEPSDAAADLLGGLDATTPAVRAFDTGCREVLRELRQQTGRANRLSDREKIASAADDLLAVIMRIRPTDVVRRLHQEFVLWNNWAENLVLDASLDVRREYLRALALTQDVAAHTLPHLNGRRFLSLWLDVCQGAGEAGPFNDTYLRVGLIGLRRLPLMNVLDGNEIAVVEGLIRWASAQSVNPDTFDREWRIVLGAYPRHSSYWQTLLEIRLGSLPRQGTAHEPLPSQPRYWLIRALDGVSSTQPMTSTSTVSSPARSHQPKSGDRARRSHPPTVKELEHLLSKISATKFAAIKPALTTMLREHRAFMNESGITDFFLRTAGRVGHAVLKSGIGPLGERSAFASSLAQETIALEPRKAHGWSLWVSALKSAGRLEDAASVAWETVRRFPGDVIARNHLSAILHRDLKLDAEAEAVLRETLEQRSGTTKDIGFARNQLAGILGSRHTAAVEAERILRETIDSFTHPDVRDVARNILATVLSEELNRHDDAVELLRETVRSARHNFRARNQLALILSRRLRRYKEAVDLLRETIAMPSDDYNNVVVARNQLAVLLFVHLNQHAEAEDLLRETIAKYPNDMGASKHLENLLHRPDELRKMLDEESAAFAFGLSSIDQPYAANAASSLPVEWPGDGASPLAQDETSMLESIRLTSRARRLLTLLRASNPIGTVAQEDEYREAVRALYAQEPNNTYLRFVANECGAEPFREEESVFALALQAACIRRAITEFDSLRSRFSNGRETAFIERARVVLMAPHQETNSEPANRHLRQIVDEAASDLAGRVAA